MQANISGGTYSKVSPFPQTNNPVTGTCSNISCHGGNNPTPQWGIGTAGCVNCHNGTVTRSVVAGSLDNVVAEFGLAWGHKKTGRGAVTNADCIVCHLEGNFTTQATSAFHADGNIDLRNPDGVGEVPITNMSGGAFTFTKFLTSYAAGSRTSTSHTSNNIDNVITQKFCLACHDNNGATNTTARTTGGTAFMPWGGINLGANYTVANGAAAAGGLVDVKTQLSFTANSAHPVTAPLNKDYPTAAKMADPYKPTGTRGTSGTLSQSVVMNCFDCHNVAGTPLTDRTVAAHGNAVTLRGVATVTGTPSSTNGTTFCQVCHPGHYGTTADNHGTGSAFSSATDGGMTPYVNYGCNICHGSRYTTAVVRPVRAQDMHGNNVVPTGSITKAGRWLAGGVSIAFIRNSYAFNDHAPRAIGATTYTPACMGGQTGQETSACNRGVENYTVGGTY
jgi:predicted CxxxxCH...CXXCH cytochrome family protein